MVAASTMPAIFVTPIQRGLTSMLFDPAARQSGSWEAEPTHDRTMLVLQYFVAFIAVAAAVLLSALH